MRRSPEESRRQRGRQRERARVEQADIDAARESLRLAQEAVQSLEGRRVDYFAAALEELLERGHHGGDSP